jgi:hypothetical protein
MEGLLVFTVRQQFEHVAFRLGFRRLMARLKLDLLVGADVPDRMKLE